MSIIHGMSNAEYHADTSAISASGLKLFMRSPAHYYAAYLDPPHRAPAHDSHAPRNSHALRHP